jgi:hypothetical protein
VTGGYRAWDGRPRVLRSAGESVVVPACDLDRPRSPYNILRPAGARWIDSNWL